MARGKRLSELERGKIIVLKEEGYSAGQIARIMNRSHTGIDNFLRLKDKYGTKKSTGRPQKLTNRQKRFVVRAVSQHNYSLRQISCRKDISVSKSTVGRVVSLCSHLQYKKRIPAPSLTARHEDERLKWAKKKDVMNKFLERNHLE